MLLGGLSFVGHCMSRGPVIPHLTGSRVLIHATPASLDPQQRCHHTARTHYAHTSSPRTTLSTRYFALQRPPSPFLVFLHIPNNCAFSFPSRLHFCAQCPLVVSLLCVTRTFRCHLPFLSSSPCMSSSPPQLLNVGRWDPLLPCTDSRLAIKFDKLGRFRSRSSSIRR